MITTNFTWLQPEAYISVKRNRLKVYDNRNYYLKDNTEFEIELFNPTNDSVLAKIWLNDELISPTGIVIKAHSRVYLERFIDSNRKFKFTVFEVDNVKETKAARNRNGMVKVAFFTKVMANNYPGTYLRSNTGDITWAQPHNMNITGISTTAADVYYTGTITTNYSNVSSTDTFLGLNNTIDQIETGRVKQGEKSNQTFTTSNENFNDASHQSYEYQILPESLKAALPQETRQYCSNCGTRIRKSSWKYCPSCGEEV